MIDCTYFAVHEARLAEWEQIYAPLNVRGELDKMKLWLDANPRRRKKKYQRFVINWLNAEHAKIERQRIEQRAMTKVGTGSSRGRVHYSADDLAWYAEQGITPT